MSDSGERPPPREPLNGSAADEKIKSLEMVATDNLNWWVLYRDPVSRELWKETFPFGERHGGGPARLDSITSHQALLEFDIVEDDLGSA